MSNAKKRIILVQFVGFDLNTKIITADRWDFSTLAAFPESPHTKFKVKDDPVMIEEEKEMTKLDELASVTGLAFSEEGE